MAEQIMTQYIYVQLYFMIYSLKLQAFIVYLYASCLLTTHTRCSYFEIQSHSTLTVDHWEDYRTTYVRMCYVWHKHMLYVFLVVSVTYKTHTSNK